MLAINVRLPTRNNRFVKPGILQTEDACHADEN